MKFQVTGVVPIKIERIGNIGLEHPSRVVCSSITHCLSIDGALERFSFDKNIRSSVALV